MRFGRYEILGPLGEGGFAQVYRARDTALERKVALKALLPHLAAHAEVRRRFLAEARSLARLRHSNVVTVYDVGEADGRPFFTMELIDGPTLEQLLARQRLPLDRVIEIVDGLAQALDCLHANRLVHRDVKPSNVMVEGSRVVLMDLGIARILDGTQLTRTGTVLGTPEYMAPEQVLDQPVGPAADVYSLGAVAYALLAGRPPFTGSTAHVLHAQAYESPPPLESLRPGLPAPAYAAVASALSKAPAARPHSAAAFADALRDVIEASGAKPDVPGDRPKLPRPAGAASPAGIHPGKSGLLIAVPAALLLLAALGLGAFTITGVSGNHGCSPRSTHAARHRSSGHTAYHHLRFTDAEFFASVGIARPAWNATEEQRVACLRAGRAADPIYSAEPPSGQSVPGGAAAELVCLVF